MAGRQIFTLPSFPDPLNPMNPITGGPGGGVVGTITNKVPDPLNPMNPVTGGPGGGIVGKAASNITNPVTDISHFLGALSNGSTWVRVAEFAIGGILIAVGVNKMLNNAPVRVTKTVAKVTR